MKQAYNDRSSVQCKQQILQSGSVAIPFAIVLPPILLQSGYDIRTVQELLGHKDVKDDDDFIPMC